MLKKRKDPDPQGLDIKLRIRIRSKMFRIRNTGYEKKALVTFNSNLQYSLDLSYFLKFFSSTEEITRLYDTVCDNKLVAFVGYSDTPGNRFTLYLTPSDQWEESTGNL
jgi:hypothetical protein